MFHESVDRVACGLDDILITDALARRASRPPDYEAEARALGTLAEGLATDPHGLLQQVVETAMRLCRASSAGVSILEHDGEHEVFRWHAMAGRYAAHLNGTILRHASPCGHVIARNTVLLMDRPGRYFAALQGAQPAVQECLLAPWEVNGQPLGTLWVISDTPDRQFDAEDARVLNSLAHLAAAAWQAATARDAAQERLRESEARQAFLVRLSDSLRDAPGPTEAMELAAAMLGEYLGASGVGYSVADDSGTHLVVERDWVGAGGTSVVGRHALDNFAWTEDAAAGRVLRVNDIADGTHVPLPKVTAAYEAIGVRSFVHVPVIHNRRFVGLLFVLSPVPRVWTDEEVHLIEAAAERTRAALERASSEAALRASEAEYHTLFEAMDEGVALCEIVRDAAGHAIDVRILALNPALETQTGLVHSGVVNRLMSEVLPGIDDMWLTTFTRVVECGQTVRLEQHIPFLDRWYDVNAFPRGGDRFAVLYDDITKRKEAEQVLRESEARQAFLLKLSDALRHLGDPSEIQREASRVLREHLGAMRVVYAESVGDDELVATAASRSENISGIAERHRISDYGADLEAMFAAGRIIARQDVANDPTLTDAKKMAFAAIQTGAWAAAPLVKSGRPVAVLTVHFRQAHEWTSAELTLIEEVAQRTWAAAVRARAEAALRESEERLRVLVESVQDYAIFTLDIQGFVTSWNEGARRIKGYTDAEILGKHASIFYTPADVAAGKPETLFRKALATGRAEDESWRVRKDGTRFWGNEVVTPLRAENGQVLGFSKVSRDLTERMRAEDALRRAHDDLERRVNERTSELGALMKRLVSVQEEERRSIARDLHDDIGQRMTVLHLKLAAIAQCVHSRKGRAQLHDTQEFALQLDRDMRFFAGELRSSSLYTLGVAAALHDLAESFTKTNGIPVVVEAIGTSPRRLASDLEVNLYRIAQEALQNVHKHAQAQRIDVILQQSDGRVVLTVTDDGRGFDPEAGHAAPTGLGLMGMRERAALIGGHLVIESAAAQGTSIVVSAPAAFR